MSTPFNIALDKASATHHYAGPVYPMNPYAMDAAQSTSFALLKSEFEKQDPLVREPLTSVFWPEMIPIVPGGDFGLDIIGVDNLDLGAVGSNQFGLISNGNTEYAGVSVNLNRDYYRVHDYGYHIRMPFIDAQKFANLGRDITGLLERSVQLNWNKTMDLVTHTGINANTPGLLNNSNVARTTAPNGAASSSTFASKTGDEIVTDIDGTIQTIWASSEYDKSVLNVTVALPPAQLSLLNRKRMSQTSTEGGYMSVLKYLMEQNTATLQGGSIKFVANRFLIGAGSSATDRMMVYVNEPRFVALDVPMPVRLTNTFPSADPSGPAMVSYYNGRIGQVRFGYYQPVAYVDGI